MINKTDYSFDSLQRARQLAAEMLKKQSKSTSYSLSKKDKELLQDKNANEYLVVGNELQFSSLDTLSKLAAEYFFYHNDDHENIDPIRKALEIESMGGSGGEGLAAGYYLALINAEDDILLRAAEAINENTNLVFEVLNLIQASFPHIGVPSVPSLVALCEAEFPLTRTDLIRGRFFNFLAERFKTDYEFLREIIKTVKFDPKESNASLYYMSLMTLSETFPIEIVEESLDDANHSNTHISTSAILVLGQMVFRGRVPSSHLADVIHTFQSHVSSSDKEIRIAALRAVSDGALVNSDIADTLDSCLDRNDQQALTILSDTLF